MTRCKNKGRQQRCLPTIAYCHAICGQSVHVIEYTPKCKKDL